MKGGDCGTGKNRRRRYLIDKSFQLSYLFDQVTVGIAAVVASVLTLFFLIFYQLSEDRLYHSAWSSTLLWDLVLLFVLLLVLAIYRGVLRSHRIAGPAYRFRRLCRRLTRGDFSEDIQLRRNDRLKDVAEAFQEMTVGLQGLVEDDRRAVTGARNALEELRKALRELDLHLPQRERVEALTSEIEQDLDRIGKGYTLSADERREDE